MRWHRDSPCVGCAVCMLGKGVSGSLPAADLEPNGVILSCSGIGSAW